MKSSKVLQVKVDELLSVLGTDIELIEKSLNRLKGLRGSLIKRDEAGMRQLLECVRSESESRDANEIRRERIKAELSDILGCDAQSMTIGVLGNFLSEIQRDRLFEKRGKLLVLTKQLSVEHAHTSMLLKEYSRLNRMFLQKVFYPNNENTGLYNSRGSVDRLSDAAFMNFKL